MCLPLLKNNRLSHLLAVASERELKSYEAKELHILIHEEESQREYQQQEERTNEEKNYI